MDADPSLWLDTLQFLWELHFIEAQQTPPTTPPHQLQFLWELHFIEAMCGPITAVRRMSCSSFGNCTSLRPMSVCGERGSPVVAVPLGTALH